AKSRRRTCASSWQKAAVTCAPSTSSSSAGRITVGRGQFTVAGLGILVERSNLIGFCPNALRLDCHLFSHSGGKTAATVLCNSLLVCHNPHVNRNQANSTDAK